LANPLNTLFQQSEANTPQTKNLRVLIDRDNDRIEDDDDAFPLNPLEHSDHDGDGIGDNEDLDDDSDGIRDSEDKNPLDPIQINRTL
jgi:hypothetical protein